MKGKIIFIMCTAIFALCMNACKTRGTVAGVSTAELTGMYAGILPCADCPGIQTRIEFQPEGTYTMQTMYVDRSEEVFTRSGKFVWDASKSIVTFDNDFVRQCLLEDNTLFVLVDGEKHTGEIADSYILVMVDMALVEKYWKLVELYGNPVVANDSNRGEAHIIFRIERNQFNGNAGCNRILGSYQIKEDGKIAFSQAISTRMMCLNMDIEDKFLQVLNTVDSYTFENDALVFSKDGDSLARFVVVYL